MLVIGVDPGLTGAISLIGSGALLECEDLPVCANGMSTGSMKSWLDVPRFWNLMAQEGYGIIDLLKVIDSRERSSRFQRLGLVNEPGFASTAKPDHHGLYIDQPVSTPPDGIDPEIYGHSTGILGLRLFPNPEFDEKAKARWNAEKFYTDVAYRTDPTLIRPYRVGMTCAM